MFLLIPGLIVFFAAHLAIAVPGLRETLVVRFGKWPYKGMIAAISIAGFILIVLGMGNAGHIGLWTPPPFARPIATGLMPLAFILVIGAYVPCNLKRLLRHPMMLGVALWAGLHLLANGDLAGLLLFGSFFAYSLFILIVRRDIAPSARTYPAASDLVVVVSGIVLYATLLTLHPLLFGHAVVF
ncbi:MAG: NnrU family protein [Gammaproteobacteria bacterium]|nr:NnrU family protein [Gammaproteobacteria bacterium]